MKSIVLSLIIIEEKNPLKQGLKRLGLHIIKLDRYIEEKNPLKQGLKPFCSRSIPW